ncbi:MAG TPA: ABC-F family ATP-binding cassette domain-containing protein [Gaiellaceae bacterium]|nr:ABC-F family ATP-binding cassette domain-containing protein [Gaiellaceae bacterium]
MAVLIASALRKELSGSVLFDGVSFKVERSDRLALAGPNGAGKTTLLRMLAGETSIDGGELALEKGTRVALHDQRPPAASPRPLREYVLAGTSDLAAVEDELRRLETAMAGGTHDAATLRRYSEAQARLEHAGGYDWRDRAASVVRGLGFSDSDLERPLSTFSGGELTRASLARALASQPDLLLLDEPTNHLDIESLEWLENMLRTLDAAVILVAHDRWFLEAVTTAVLELENGKSIYFPGAWHVWRREEAARDIHQAKTAARQAERIARLERFVERFRYKNTKARQAQSKLKQIDRIKKDQVFAPDRRKHVLGFEFLKPARSGRDVVVAEELDVSAGDKELLDGASFFVQRGEHVALVGPNGSGKTTLLETMLGRRDARGGVVRLGHGVEAAYFSQHEVELDERGSVLEAAMAGTGLKRPEAQKLLGQFLFSGWDEHEKPVVALSGGERRRLALAIVVASGANFLVLDEPTNHLDLESRESLERALEAFPGTVLLVSHDRALLDAVADRLLAVEDKNVASYAGGWADYVRAQEPEAAAPPPPPKEKAAKPKRAAKPRTSKTQPTALELVEREVARAEQRVSDLESKLAQDWSDMALLAAHREAREDLQALLQRWESLMGA